MGVLKAAAGLGLVLCLGGQASAQTNELKTQLQARRKLEVAATIQSVSNLYREDSVDHEGRGRITLAPSYRLNERLRTTLSASVLQDFAHDQKTLLSNTKWTLSHKPVRLSEDTMFFPVAGIRLPTNVEDRKKNTYNGSLVLEPTVITQWSPASFNFQTIYSLFITKNTHTYDRNSQGEANLSYMLANYFAVEKYVWKNIYLTFDGEYTYAKTYQDSLRTFFSFGQYVTYEGNKWSFTFGHSNEGDALEANGTDYNMKVFDQNTSVLYASLRVSY